MKQFNTSGPNIFDKHYTISRSIYLNRGTDLVKDDRYFTIWAPRQTGKSTYFRQLAEVLNGLGYEVAHINFENYKDESIEAFLKTFRAELQLFWQIDFSDLGIVEIFHKIEQIKNRKLVLIIDEVEGINHKYLGTFLHSIRAAYHSREEHALKSVILVGSKNVIELALEVDVAFNIAEYMTLDFFNQQEVTELLTLYEKESNQKFQINLKDRIYELTNGHPNLVNILMNQLVIRFGHEEMLTLQHLSMIEEWYIKEGFDKNLEDKIKENPFYRHLLERLLFLGSRIMFNIRRDDIRQLLNWGIVQRKDENVVIAVPLYKKRLYEAFYPYTNGESNRIGGEVVRSHYFDANGKFKLDTLIQNFKAYVKRRGFGVFREKTGEKDDDGNPIYKSIPEAAMVYAFETYIQAVLQVLEGKTYREAQVALGRTDLLVNVKGEEFLIETKIFYHELAFQNGKKQLAYYCNHLNLKRGVYLVFIPEHLLEIHKENISEGMVVKEDVEVHTYLVTYEDEIPDYRKPITKRRITKKK